MPQIHDPLRATRRDGRPSGAVVVAKRSRVRRRKKTTSTTTTPQNTRVQQEQEQPRFLGEDLLDFCSDTTNDHRSSSTTTTTAAKNRNPSNRTMANTSEPRPSLEQPRSAATTTNNKNNNNNNNVNSSSIHHHRHALAIDTRYLDTNEGKHTNNVVLAECRRFLEMLVARGLKPCHLSWTELQPAAATKAPVAMGIRYHSNDDCDSSELGRRIIEAAVPFRPHSHSTVPVSSSGPGKDPTKDHGTTKAMKPSVIARLPKGLLAYASWKLFGDFVESMVLRQQQQQQQSNSGSSRSDLLLRSPPPPPPLDITILTNDVAFLSDTNLASHKRALNEFWDRVQPHFSTCKLRTLHVVVLSTDSVVIVGNSKEEESVTDDTERLERKRALGIAECVNELNQHLDGKGQAEFKEKRSLIQFQSKEHIPTTNIHVSTIDNTNVGFQFLLRKFSRDNLCSRSSHRHNHHHHHHHHRVTFDLPETMDAQCSVALDTVYKYIPFRLDSPLVEALFNDLGLLSDSNFEVVQLVPISSIDASLLYGVAIGVRAGLLGHDLDRHNEMRLLVRTLFQQLTAKDCALLLRSKGPPPEHKHEHELETTTITITTTTLFHSTVQSWLLMAEEVPGPLKSRTAPCTGVLYRFACAEHILQESSPADHVLTSDDKQEIENPFSEYVEASLDCLGSLPVNPIYLEAAESCAQLKTTLASMDRASSLKAYAQEPTRPGKSKKPSMIDAVLEPEKVLKNQRAIAVDDDLILSTSIESGDEMKWNDKSGVGSRPGGFSQDSDEILDSDGEEKECEVKVGTVKSRQALTAVQRTVLLQSPMDEEVEWTDDSTVSFPSPDSESETSDTKDAFGKFDYQSQ